MCCICNGTCNHVGPCGFCYQHQPQPTYPDHFQMNRPTWHSTYPSSPPVFYPNETRIDGLEEKIKWLEKRVHELELENIVKRKKKKASK